MIGSLVDHQACTQNISNNYSFIFTVRNSFALSLNFGFSIRFISALRFAIKMNCINSYSYTAHVQIITLYTLHKKKEVEDIGIEECEASERRSLDWCMVNSKETRLKFVAKIQKPCKKIIENKEYRKRVVKEKLKTRKAMSLHWHFETDNQFSAIRDARLSDRVPFDS